GRSCPPSFAAFAAVAQIAFVYLTTAVAKSGTTWHDGTALYYVLHIDEFVTPLCRSAGHLPSPVLAGLTFRTLALEYATVFLVLLPWGQPWLRRLAIAGLSAFHLGTAFTMTLSSFPFVMIASYALLLGDADWRAVARLVPAAAKISQRTAVRTLWSR